jgi:integrase
MANFTKRENGKWQAKIRRKGWPNQSKAFQTLEAAQQWARATEREMDIGAFISRNDAERMTFSEACNKFTVELLTKHSGQRFSALEFDGKDLTAANIKDAIKKAKLSDELLPGLKRTTSDLSRIALLKSHFGKYSLAALSPLLISSFRDARLKVMSGQTVKHELNLISRILKKCVFDWGISLPQGIPTAVVRKPSVKNARERRLEPGEWELLHNALLQCRSQVPLAIVEFAIETAARRSEILSLTWDDVELKSFEARLRGIDGAETKNGSLYRTVPLSSKAVAVLSTQTRSTDKKSKVFNTTESALKQSFEHAVKRARKGHINSLLLSALIKSGLNDDDAHAEIRAHIYHKRTPTDLTVKLLAIIEADDNAMNDLHFHDLRHEATSRLAEKLQMHELMKVTGHKSSSMVARYYHPRASDLAKKLG